MQLTSDKPEWRRSVKIMRIACPAAFAAAALLCVLSLIQGLALPAVINAFLMGANAVLTWVQWRIFQL